MIQRYPILRPPPTETDLDQPCGTRYRVVEGMMNMTLTPTHDYEYTLNELTLEKAAALVPPEFLPAWSWYQTMQGSIIPRLPRGKDAPKDAPIKLAAQRGIHTPGVASLADGWRNDRRYAPLSTHPRGIDMPARV